MEVGFYVLCYQRLSEFSAEYNVDIVFSERLTHIWFISPLQGLFMFRLVTPWITSTVDIYRPFRTNFMVMSFSLVEALKELYKLTMGAAHRL